MDSLKLENLRGKLLALLNNDFQASRRDLQNAMQLFLDYLDTTSPELADYFRNDAPWTGTMTIHPSLKEIHDHPRFRELAHSMKRPVSEPRQHFSPQSVEPNSTPTGPPSPGCAPLAIPVQFPTGSPPPKALERPPAETSNALALLEQLQQIFTRLEQEVNEAGNRRGSESTQQADLLMELTRCREEKNEFQRREREREAEFEQLRETLVQEHRQKWAAREEEHRRELSELRAGQQAALDALNRHYQAMMPEVVLTLFGIEITDDERFLALATPLFSYLAVIHASDRDIVRRFKNFDMDFSELALVLPKADFNAIRGRIEEDINHRLAGKNISVTWNLRGHLYDNRFHNATTDSGRTITEIRLALIKEGDNVLQKAYVLTE